MDDDWDIDDEPVKSGSSTPAPAAAAAPAPRVAAKMKWQGEDDEDEEDDDWDASEDEKPKAAAPTTVAPTKKKMSLKQKLAEKDKLAAEGKLNEGAEDDLMDTVTIQERRRQARERELEADMAVAAELMGGLGNDDGPETLKLILEAKPTSKDAFNTLSKQYMSALISRHESNPLYSAFVEQFTKDLCENLTAVQTRKIASALSVLGNTKQQDERDRASGKKKGVTKPKAAIGKASGKADVEAYNEVLDDDVDDGFM